MWLLKYMFIGVSIWIITAIPSKLSIIGLNDGSNLWAILIWTIVVMWVYSLFCIHNKKKIQESTTGILKNIHEFIFNIISSFFWVIVVTYFILYYLVSTESEIKGNYDTVLTNEIMLMSFFTFITIAIWIIISMIIIWSSKQK